MSPTELGAALDEVAKLARSKRYREQFLAAFGREPTILDVAAALASYVRTIVAGDAPFDRFVAGDARALGESARRGFVLFRTRARCTTCHAGPLLADDKFHNTGVAWRNGTLTDEERSRVTQSPADRGAFKTATLREIARTAPYMHDGSFRTLQEVVDFTPVGVRYVPESPFWTGVQKSQKNEEGVMSQQLVDAAKAPTVGYNDKNWEAVERAVASDFSYDEVATHRNVRGVDDVIGIWKRWAAAFPDSKATFDRRTSVTIR